MMSTSKNPLGLEDLFNLQLRPTRRFVEDKRDIYLERVASKDWVNIGPLLKQD